MTQWPKQSQCDLFYGNPRGKGGAVSSPAWTKANLVWVKPPFKMAMDAPVTQFPIHRKCKEATLEWLAAVWKNAGQKQATIHVWGMDVFSGSYVFRTMRGLRSLSMHSYGCAMDFDAPRNGMSDRTPHFAAKEIHDAVVKPFLALGGVWGGDWNGNGSSADERRCDGMHFQFARMG
jgi:hypothetical protein